MILRGLRRTARVCPVLVLIGCGGGEPLPPVKPQSVLPPPVESPPTAFASPARWSFHPPLPTKATAARKIEEGSCLATTVERLRIRTTKWEKSPTGNVICSGQWKAATDIAPEALVGSFERKGSWMFVGATGNLYESEEPLGQFQRLIPAPKSFAKVAGGGNTILAIATEGQVLRLDESLSWRPIALPEGHAFDVGVADNGNALLLALPEKLYASTNGQTFNEVAVGQTVGAQRIGATDAGLLAARGLTGTLVWDPQETPAISHTRDAGGSHGVVLDLEDVTMPSATAVVEGRAALDGDRYIEAVASPDESGIWSLATGSFEGPLTSAKLPGTEGCSTMRVGARGRFVTILCLKADDSGNHVAVVRASSDGGKKFGEWSRFTASDDDLVRVAVANDGTTLITGICITRPGMTGCVGSPPTLLQVNNGVITSTLAAAPPLMGLPISPAFSGDGKSAYFLGRRAKDERLALFVSHDGGRAFAERSLASRASADSAGGSDEPGERQTSEESFEPSELTTVRPSDDGTIGMVLTTSRGLSYLTMDDDGRVLGMTQAPVEQAMMAGYGRRVIALSANPDATPATPSAVKAWESDDGGLNWNDLSTTAALGRELALGPMTAACSNAGCLIGSTITRVGWQGQAALPPLVSPSAPEMPKVKAVHTPLVCTLDPKNLWKQTSHVWTGAPRLSTIARGRALWSMLSFDPTNNSVATTVAQWPDRGEGAARITNHTMLGPTPKGTTFLVDISRQIEGYVASRVRLPNDGRLDGPMRNIEVAWENYVEGTSKQTTIPDAGMFLAGDVTSMGLLRFFKPGFVSITAGGVFIRPHARATSDQRLFLLDTKGNQTNIEFPAWKDMVTQAKANVPLDMALVEGKPMAIATVDQGSEEDEQPTPLTVVMSPPTEGGVSKPATATSLLPPALDDQDRWLNQDWSYRGPSEVGVMGLVDEPRAGRAKALFFPFRADGTFGKPFQSPTPFDLPPTPRPCKSKERLTTPRFAAPGPVDGEAPFPGTHHPVLVSEVRQDKLPANDDMVLLTWGTVLHGTKESPCVAGWEAYSVGPSPLVAVIGGDPSQAFLFRMVERVMSEQERARLSVYTENVIIEHRPMTCRFDAAAPIPEAVWSQAATWKWTTK